MASILITGGSGLIGNHLARKLTDKGYSIAILARSKHLNEAIPAYTWDIDKHEIENKALKSVDYIIHLAGANIGSKRWTSKRKKQIVDSRVKSGQLLFEKLKENKNQVKAFISASAIGYYGAITTDHIFTETDPPGSDFLGDTCKQWEQSADHFEQLGIRTVKIRTGVVLTKKHGALAKMMIPFKLGIGSVLGTGEQFMPWIHIDDLCGIYIKAVEDIQMQGVYNAAAPDYKTNREFTETLARVLKKLVWFPDTPALLLRLIFGKAADIILKGSRVSPEKIINAGYHFKFHDLENALVNLVT